jgi:glycosyltransferase involved in cell wall biosynthesis
MVRVLLLRAEPSDDQSRRLSALLAIHASHAAVIELRTIGRGGTYRSVLDAMLRLRGKLARFDVVHVWDQDSFTVAQWAGAPAVLGSLVAGVAMPVIGPALLRGRRGDLAHWACSTPWQLASTAARFGSDTFELVEPGVEFLAATKTREAIRSALGLTADDHVFLAPGESTREAGHETAVWVMSMLHIIDPRYKLLIAGTGPYARAARRMAAALNWPESLRVAADAGIEGSIMPAADAVLFTPTGESPVLPVAECMAAGLPVVTTDHPAFRGFFAEGHGVLLAEWKKPPSVGRRALELFEQPGLLQVLAERARDEALKRFSVPNFVQRYMRMYQEMAGRTRRGVSHDGARRNTTAAFA